MNAKVVVVGSLNMDLVVRAQRLPRAGETLPGDSFFTVPGGKGANQAVAVARLGGSVAMIGNVGMTTTGGNCTGPCMSRGSTVRASAPVQPCPAVWR